MVDFVELQYATMISNRLERFKIKHTNPYKINFRCPLCGDSQKSRVKARGWLLEDDSSHLRFYCHNCFQSLNFSEFLESVDPLIFKDYLSEKLLNKYANKNIVSTLEKAEYKKPNFSNKVNISKIKKISQLAFDHPAKVYIDKRDIPKDQHYRIYYAPKFMTWINTIIPDKFKNIEKDEPRIVLPFYDEDKKVFGVSARGFNPNGLRYITIMFDESKPKIFGLENVDFSKKYFIVEGAFDSFFIKNSIAMAGADGNTKGLKNLENSITVFDNEPRNKEIHKRMEKVIKEGRSICIWPSYIEQKDINEMHLSGVKNIENIIKENTFSGLEATLKLASWRKS